MPPKRSTPKVLHRASELRKEATPAEKKLWTHLRLMRGDGVRFRRHEVLAFAQGHAIGSFIADFCAPRSKLIIELDGSPHLEQKDQDKGRTKYLESKGYQVIPQGDDVRFWNNQVMDDIDGVIRAILHAMESEARAG